MRCFVEKLSIILFFPLKKNKITMRLDFNLFDEELSEIKMEYLRLLQEKVKL